MAVLDGAKQLHQVPVHVVGAGVAATAAALTATGRRQVCRSQRLADARLDGRQGGVDGQNVQFRARLVQNIGGGRVEGRVSAQLGRQLQGGRVAQGQRLRRATATEASILGPVPSQRSFGGHVCECVKEGARKREREMGNTGLGNGSVDGLGSPATGIYRIFCGERVLP